MWCLKNIQRSYPTGYSSPICVLIPAISPQGYMPSFVYLTGRFLVSKIITSFYTAGFSFHHLIFNVILYTTYKPSTTNFYKLSKIHFEAVKTQGKTPEFYGIGFRLHLLAIVFQCLTINSHLASVFPLPLLTSSIQYKLSCGRTLFLSKL